MKKLLTVAFFVLIGSYALFQGRYLILGPRIHVDAPTNNSLVDAGALTLSGSAKNISYLSVNDRQIYTDTAGRFEERLIAQSGINIIKLEARDRFGRQEIELVQIVAR